MDLSFIQPIISATYVFNLLAPFTDVDIKDVFFDMNPHKASGSDGLGAKFFQAYWHTIGKDICLAIHDFFHHGHLPPSLNHTIIALISQEFYSRNV